MFGWPITRTLRAALPAALLVLASCGGERPAGDPAALSPTAVAEPQEIKGIAWPNFMLLDGDKAFGAQGDPLPEAAGDRFRVHLDVPVTDPQRFETLRTQFNKATPDHSVIKAALLPDLPKDLRARALIDHMPVHKAGNSPRWPRHDLIVDRQWGVQGSTLLYRFELDLILPPGMRPAVRNAIANGKSKDLLNELDKLLPPLPTEVRALLEAITKP